MNASEAPAAGPGSPGLAPVEDVRDTVAEDAPALGRLLRNVDAVFRGKSDVVELALTALLARGHVLFEDIPGTGKTTLARSIAASLLCPYRRIQFTSDLLPSDVLGVSIYREDEHRFELKPGPIFASLVLADEVNRTTPRTQSALLEAMSEGRVTIDDATHSLPRPFMVIATQNPKELYGTYPLPENQLDRFMLRLSIGYPEPDVERSIVQGYGFGDPVEEMQPVAATDDVLRWQRRAERVHVDEAVMDYVMALVAETRDNPHFALGVSTRGAIALYRAAQAHAYLLGRHFVTPDDVQRLVVPAWSHRVWVKGYQEGGVAQREEAATILADVVESSPVPR